MLKIVTVVNIATIKPIMVEEIPLVSFQTMKMVKFKKFHNFKRRTLLISIIR